MLHREFLNAIDVLEEEIEQVQGNLPNLIPIINIYYIYYIIYFILYIYNIDLTLLIRKTIKGMTRKQQPVKEKFQ